MSYHLSTYTTHYKNLIFLGVPIIVGQLGNIILSFADTLMVGHHSTYELAAAAFVNNVFALAILMSLGFSYAITPIVGKLFGQGRPSRIGEVMKNAFVANTVTAIILMIAMGILYLNVEHLGQPKELLPLIKDYYLIQYVSLPFISWFNTFKQFFDGITDTLTAMCVIVVGNVMNIFGNWVLIFGHFGFPDMGLNGSGLSTLFARVVMALILFTLFRRHIRYKVYAEGWCKGKLSWADFKEQNSLGWPLSFQMGLEAAAFGASSIMVGWIGTIALAAHQVMLTISQLGYMIYYGLAAAVAVRTSNFAGRKDWEAVWITSRAGLHLILLLAFTTCIPIFCCRHIIGGIFTDNVQVQQLVAMLVVPFMIYQFGDGMQVNYANSLRGIGYVKPLMGVAFVSYFLTSLSMSYLLGIYFHGGIVGVWAAFPISLTLAGILYYYYYRKGMSRIEQAS